MKPVHRRLACMIGLALATCACVPQPRPAPPVDTRPVPATPTTAAAPAPVPVPANWLDRPASPGDWYYRGDGASSLALFGGRNTEAEFMLRCDRSNGTVSFIRASESPTPRTMQILTETTQRTFTARPDGGALPNLVATLPARDSLFDAMALSKGRFAVEVADEEPLYLPSWAEVTRVIEDCR